MSTTPATLTLGYLAQLVGKPYLTLADLESINGQLQPDGSCLRTPKVPPEQWAALAPGTRIAFRLKGEAALQAGEVVSNSLAYLLLPSLVIRHLSRDLTGTVRRRQLRDVYRLELTPGPG
ncbi:hypothetical protein GCM10023172_27480 [Hymenobacter ginsengisoli]|uniref:Uncharacterized protein n=1 Tax=Hymenobacter ginsengisoli TaxID=1051626 RepID=A0ABP8QH17_9BACT|nr:MULTISPECIES: hypothetical protein [unclassified Hymenobacter]MBO2029997.1 hypothetical protein [Hymenobacter sp. BT559]